MHPPDCCCLACLPACAPPPKAEFDALPPRWRRYVCDLETIADPAGMVRENAMLRDRVEQLEAAREIERGCECSSEDEEEGGCRACPRKYKHTGPCHELVMRCF